MADWSMLPCDILGCIALRMDTPEEFACFSSVCHSWNRGSSVVKSKWRSKVPYLLLSQTTQTKNKKRSPTKPSIRKIYSIGTNRCYQMVLPETLGARCWGSSCGLITIFDTEDIYLLNPLTKARICLPPPSTLPIQLEGRNKASRSWIVTCYIYRAILLQVVENGSKDFIVMVVHGGSRKGVAFARPGDQTWTLLCLPNILDEQVSIADIVVCGRQVFFVYWDGMVRYCDIGVITDKQNLQPLELNECCPGPTNAQEIFDNLMKLYLVNVFGDLFMVVRYKLEFEVDGDEDDVTYVTKDFKVYRLEFDTKRWIQVNSVGDVALFVGDNTSMFVRAQHGGCKSNCIYFTDDEMEYWSLPQSLGGHDAGVFNVETNEIGKVYEGDDIHSSLCTPFWFMPQF